MKTQSKLAMDKLAGLASEKPHSEAEIMRLSEELAWVERRGLASVFIDWVEKIDALKGQGVLVGPGRGSIGGSYLAWSTGLTEINPQKLGLSQLLFLRDDRSELTFHFDVSRRSLSREEGLYFDEALSRIASARVIAGGRPREAEISNASIMDRLKKGWHHLDPSISSEATEMLKKMPPQMEAPLELSLALSRPGPQQSEMTATFLSGEADEKFTQLWPETNGVPVYLEQWLSLSSDSLRDPRVLELQKRWRHYGYIRSHAIGRSRIGWYAAEMARWAPDAWARVSANTNQHQLL